MIPASASGLAPAAVSAGTWAIVPEASTARFTVRDKLVTTVHGSFPVRSGTATIRAGGDVAGAHVELDVAGVATGNARRDKDLRNARFLDAVGHPTLVVQTGPSAAGASGWQLAATLSARGASVPLTLEVTPMAQQGERVTVRVTGRLDRTGLRIKAPTFIVGRYIDIEVQAVFEPA